MTPAGQAQNLRFRKAPGSENVVLTPTAVTLAAVTLAAVTPAAVTPAPPGPRTQNQCFLNKILN